jgi:hypothetical protein
MRPEQWLPVLNAQGMPEMMVPPGAMQQSTLGPPIPSVGLPGIYSDYYPPEFWKYNSQYAGKLEWIGWRWWDSQQYVSGTTTNLPNFFGAIRATPDVGNMKIAGQLSAPSAFLIRAVGWYLKQRPRSVDQAATANPQTGALDNVAQLGTNGVATLSIGQKVYGQWMLWQLPSGGGAWGAVATAGGEAVNVANDWAVNGFPDARNLYTLSKPIFIAPQINFQVDLIWPAAITLAGGDTYIQFFLEGDIVRPVQ